MRELTEEDQRARREASRRHWHSGVPFNKLCGTQVVRWDPDGVTVALPYSESLCAHAKAFHGGVISTLIDIAATGAVMAGHDFSLGPFPVTLSLTVQYLAMAEGEDVVANAYCRKRGRTNFVEAEVKTVSGILLAQGLTTVAIVGHSKPKP